MKECSILFTKNEIEYYKDKFKRLDPRDLMFANLLDEGRNSGFVCPFCGNGTGDDGTGVKVELLNDGYKGYCFKCGRSFDVFDLVAEKYRFNVRTQFLDVLEKAVEIFGTDNFEVKPAPKAKSKPETKEPEDFSGLIKKSWENLDAFYSDRKTWRGLEKATLTVFGCGYLPDWNFGFTSTERVIIPTSVNHYLARYVGAKPAHKSVIKIHRGAKEIFGSKKALDILKQDSAQPVFAVEGEIDVMSIYQCGFTAIAFSGSDISSHQQALLDKFPKGSALILMLDNDETGKLKSPKCARTLQKLGFNVYERFLEGDGDFNDHLQKNPDDLKHQLQNIFDDAVNYFKQNPVKKELPKGIQRVDGVPEITHDFKPNFEEKIERENQETQVQIPSCPINLTVPKGFVFKPKGIYHLEKSKDKDSKGETFEVLDCSTPIVPTRILQKKDRSGKTLELAYFERGANKWHKITAPATTIAKTQLITDLADFGVDVNSTHARSISEFLMKIQHEADNLKKIPQVLIHELPGWTSSDCEKFICPPEGSDDGESFVIQNGGFNYDEKFSSAGTKETWFDEYNVVYCGKEFAWIRYAIGLVLAAPLVRLCKSRNWQGVLIAPSGSAKSAVAKLAMSIFGNPDKLRTTFNGTNNSMDELAARYNDLPCWIDEFQSADENTRKNFSNFIYNYAEGKTRSRLARNADMKRQYEFAGTRICTSEQVVLQDNFSQGAFNRVIQIKNFEPLSDEAGRQLHQNLSKTYGHFGKKFIEYVREHKDDVRKTFANVQKKYCEMNFIEHHLQQIALVYTAHEFFWQMLKADRQEAIAAGVEGAYWTDDPSPLEFLEQFDIKFFRELLPTPQESSNIIRGRNFLAEVLISYARRFDTFDANRNEFIARAEQTPALGCKFVNGDVAFYPRKINDFLLENHFPPAPDLMEGLKREGLLDLPKSGQGLKISKRFSDKGALRVYIVKKTAFDFAQ